MYDLSGIRRGETARVRDDWRMLREKMEITQDPAYLHHDENPVVAVWGIGFNDRRDYSLNECRELVQWLKADGSWHNLKGEKLDAIPRRGGQFLWSQIVAAKRATCQMMYVAMFDEVDEGTAIFKCTNDPPEGDGVRDMRSSTPGDSRTQICENGSENGTHQGRFVPRRTG